LDDTREFFHDFIISALMDDEALESVAHLSRVGITEKVDRLDHSIDISITEDNPWGGSSEFHHTTDSFFECCLCESSPDSGASRKGDKIDIFLYERISEFTTSIDFTPYSFWKI